MATTTSQSSCFFKVRKKYCWAKRLSLKFIQMIPVRKERLGVTTNLSVALIVVLVFLWHAWIYYYLNKELKFFLSCCLMNNLLPSKSNITNITRCPHAVVITSQRHGSSWFVNCIDNCSFSQVDHELNFDAKLYLKTELWNPTFKLGPVANISFNETLNYLKVNHSLKILPNVHDLHHETIQKFLVRVASFKLPIVVLRRNLSNAFKSYTIAKRTRQFNINSKQSNGERTLRLNFPRDIMQENNFVMKINSYFHNITSFLKRKNIVFEKLWYEEIRENRTIFLKSQNCEIFNCNYHRNF